MSTKPEPSLKGPERIVTLAAAGLEAGAVPSGTTFAIEGAVETVPDVLATLEHFGTLFSDAREKILAARAAVAFRNAADPAVRSYLRALRAALEGVLGSDSATLESLGFRLRKPRAKLTPEQRLAKAAKARETRRLRQTLGPKQRASLKASGTPVISIDVPAAESNSSAAEPKAATAPATPPVSPSSGGAHA